MRPNISTISSSLFVSVVVVVVVVVDAAAAVVAAVCLFVCLFVRFIALRQLQHWNRQQPTDKSSQTQTMQATARPPPPPPTRIPGVYSFIQYRRAPGQGHHTIGRPEETGVIQYNNTLLIIFY